MKHRRVIVGLDGAGRSAVLEDRLVAPDVLAPRGNELTTLWSSDDVVALGAVAAGVTPQGFVPPPGGWRASLLTFQPDSAELLPAGQGALLADLGAAMQQGGGRGMHTTPTVDVVSLLVGELVLELDDNVELHLRPGDTVIQQAARHGWRNRTDQTATILLFMAGAGTTDESEA